MKTQILSATMLMLATTVGAQQIDVDEATLIAQRHFVRKSMAVTNGQQHAPMRPSNIATELAYTARTAQDKAALYVFNQDEREGFVIVSANDTEHPILGYSEHGSFCYDSIPDNVRWWIDQFKSAPQATALHARNAMQRASIAPLIQTKWGQGEPFNNAIPLLNNQRPLTGCVATAMAQLMKYYNYPAQATGSVNSTMSFWKTNHWVDKNYSVDLSQFHFDWANMRNYYKGNYTEEEAQAVSQLMYAAGLTVEMDYGMSQSAGNIRMVPGALSQNFGYDKSGYEANRFEYSDEEWEELIYQELAARRPVVYNGGPTSNRHQFICTGYDADEDLYYFNWGWEGRCDGLYAITPNEQYDGLKPDRYNFNSSQSIYVNIKPDCGGDYVCRLMLYDPLMGLYNGTEFQTLEVGADDIWISLKLQPWNLSALVSNFEYGFAFRNIANGEITHIDGGKTTGILKHRHTTTLNKSLNTKWLTENGEYEIVVYARFYGAGEFVPMLMMPNTVNPHVIVSGRNAPSKVDVSFELSSDNISARTTATLKHNPLYTGAVSYTSSNNAIATVDGNGVITGVKAGKATIKAVTVANEVFNATTQSFDINVTPYEPVALPISLDHNEIEEGQTAQITWASDYAGAVTFEVENPAVVSITDRGVVTALAEGSTLITVRAAAAGDYRATEKSFYITVNRHYPGGFMITNLKKPNRGYCLYPNLRISYTFKSLVDQTDVTRYKINIKCGVGGQTYDEGYIPVPAGFVANDNVNVNLSGYDRYIDRYPVWTVTFLQEDGITPIEVDGALSHDFTMSRGLPITLTMDTEWKAVCFPYEVDLPSGFEVYMVEGTLGDNLQVNKITGRHLEMGTPYLIHGTPGSYDLVGPDVPYDEYERTNGMLRGSVSQTGTTLQQGDYILTQKNGQTCFTRVSAQQVGQKVAAYTGVLHLDPTSQLCADHDFFWISPSRIGDANEDMTFDVGDVVSIQNKLNGTPSQYFDSTAADLDHDNQVTEQDLKIAREQILITK